MTDSENPQTTDSDHDGDDVAGHRHTADTAPGIRRDAEPGIRRDAEPGIRSRHSDDDGDDVAGHRLLDAAPGVSGAVNPDEDLRS